MLNSIPLLLDVVILAVFYFVLFGAININIFAGSLKGRSVHACGQAIAGDKEGERWQRLCCLWWAASSWQSRGCMAPVHT